MSDPGVVAPVQPLPPLVDGLGRAITYLRLSLTDRCDLRCCYCSAGRAALVPREQILSLEELARVAQGLIRLGVRKVRLTGGEPLIRRDVMTLVRTLGGQLAAGALEELTLTTNGRHLARYAADLAAAGVRRLNLSLDTLDPARFAAITGGGRLEPVLQGLAAARQAGLAVRLNCVALRGVNEDEFDRLLAWAGEQGCDLCLIELMPLGGGEGAGEGEAPYRPEHYLPLPLVRQRLARRWTLTDSPYRSGGPARYLTVAETGGRLGLIAARSERFCGGCNRVRLTAGGALVPCLGRPGAFELRPLLRRQPEPLSELALEHALRTAVAQKPAAHDFDHGRNPALALVPRCPISRTGG